VVVCIKATMTNAKRAATNFIIIDKRMMGNSAVFAGSGCVYEYVRNWSHQVDSNLNAPPQRH